MSMSQYSTEDLEVEDDESDRSSDSSISPNLKFSFEDWHAPFMLHTPYAIEFDEEGSQILLIPSSSPFHQPPPTPQFNASFDSTTSDCSYPSVCPTLSSQFDLFHDHSSISCTAPFNISSGAMPATPGLDGTTQASPVETVVIVDSSDDDEFPNSHGIHIVRDDMVDSKIIPDFPQDARLPCMHVH